MGNMILGTYTFESNPADLDEIVGPKKSCASVPTYSGVAFFSWGSLVAGVEVELTWDYMSCEQYDDLDALYQADAAVVWDPQDGQSPAVTYNVEITDLTGRYFIGLDPNEDWPRRDVRMKLLILSEVT
jgi:hypothetical protein